MTESKASMLALTDNYSTAYLSHFHLPTSLICSILLLISSPMLSETLHLPAESNWDRLEVVLYLSHCRIQRPDQFFCIWSTSHHHYSHGEICKLLLSVMIILTSSGRLCSSNILPFVATAFILKINLFERTNSPCFTSKCQYFLEATLGGPGHYDRRSQTHLSSRIQILLQFYWQRGKSFKASSIENVKIKTKTIINSKRIFELNSLLK